MNQKTNMSNINKIIEEQKKSFNDTFYHDCEYPNRKCKGDEDTCIIREQKGDVWNWHKQSIITLLDTLIEEKKKDIIPDPETDYQRGYNSALEEDITNLTNIKNNIK